ncbi:MAG: crossover junction endodeoxyribonuclease RuvC [Candidatus Pacebacteria bacterium]|nr:crossover junction endodeoxyribonuclease RuvC [Candidatus Paceibacterota bacterium]MDD3919173.1 crossover junction endodeoxyribonuclease RuvC [Candidatus Paceibacterota bacterium]
MKILGLDPGTATTGFGIIEATTQDELSCLHYGAIITPPNTKDEERLISIHSELKSIIKEFKPDAVSIEKLYFFKNQKTIIPVSQARGVLLLTIANSKIPIFEFTPPQVKMAVTGYGRAQKRQVQEMVQRLLNLEKIPKPDDAADALALAIAYSYLI